MGAKRVYLRFDDGVCGEIDLANRIEFVGVFAPLADEKEFAKVRVDPDLGTIVWPGGADLAPETLYAWLTGGDPGASVSDPG